MKYLRVVRLKVCFHLDVEVHRTASLHQHNLSTVSVPVGDLGELTVETTDLLGWQEVRQKPILLTIPYSPVTHKPERKLLPRAFIIPVVTRLPVTHIPVLLGPAVEPVHVVVILSCGVDAGRSGEPC